MTLAWWWMLALMPVPWLIARLFKAVDAGDRLDHPVLARWSGGGARAGGKSRLKSRWLWLVWALLLVALARPQTLGPWVEPEQPARAIMLVVDVSRSMEEPDMEWDGQRVRRYQAVQQVVGDFARQRQGDALGLVVFGEFADTQAPLTPDVEAVRDLLFDVLPGMAGDSTAIGDALGLAVRRLRSQPVTDPVILLLSDGENNAGELEPMEAAGAARDSGIRVHTIAFGQSRSGNFFGLMRGAGVDVETLGRVARETGGELFVAENTDELARVYDRIDTIEPSPRSGQPQRLAADWFWVPALAALLVLVAGQHVRVPRRKRRVS
jgi:Ca-activated chloride channel family protein